MCIRDRYLTSNVWVNPCHVAPEALECLDQAIAAIDDEGDPIQNLRIATASVFVDRLQNCRHVLWSLVHDGRTGGVLPLAASAMGLLAVDFILTGRWDEADQLSDEGIEICARHGYELLAWNLQQTKSMLASYRGNERTTQEITAEMMRWATPRRVRAVHEFWNLALHSAALGNGDYETAYQCAIAITAPGELPPYVSIAVFTLFGLVEAAVRTGRQVEAEAHVRAMEEANLQAISSRLALVVAGAQGLVASDEDATSLFQKAVNLPGVDQWPFDLARVEPVSYTHLRIVDGDDLVVVALDDEQGNIDLLQVVVEVGLGELLDAVVGGLQADLHAHEPEGIQGPLRDCAARPVGAVERLAQVLVELGTVAENPLADPVEDIDGQAAGIARGLEHDRWHSPDEHGLADPGCAVSADIAHDFAASGGVADEDRVVEVERFDELGQVVGVVVHVVALP